MAILLRVRTRLASLRAMLLSFGPDVQDVWMKYRDLDLNSNPTYILGPVGCFIWGCQLLGWQVSAPFEILTPHGIRLHVLQTPLKTWRQFTEQAWVDWAISKAKMSTEIQVDFVPWPTYKSLWSQRKMKDFPLALKFRTLGILSGSAQAQMKGMSTACEFCGQPEAGHCHLLFRCPHTQSVREKPCFAALKDAPLFTRCTGIPSMPKPLIRSTAPNPTWKFHNNQTRVFAFTDGSASPPSLPHVRCSSWAVSVSERHMDPPQSWVSGITPGRYQDISRAETFAILACLETIALCHIYCDNQGVVQVMTQLLAGTFDLFNFRGHPNIDLWLRIQQLLVTRPPGSVSISKVKSHQDPSILLQVEDLLESQG